MVAAAILMACLVLSSLVLPIPAAMKRVYMTTSALISTALALGAWPPRPVPASRPQL